MEKHMVDCPHCNGSGAEPWWTEEDDASDLVPVCEVCDGYGFLEEDE